MTLREATWRDVFRIRRWRNHPSTRKQMGDTKRIGIAEHLRWFRRIQQRTDAVQFIVWCGPYRVGSARLHFANVTAMPRGYYELHAGVDIVIAPKFRRRGYGTEAIRELLYEARQRGADRVVALVRGENVASHRTFLAAGFSYAPCPGEKGSMVLERRLPPCG